MLYAQPRPDRLLEYQDSGEVPTTPFTLEELIARLKKMYLSHPFFGQHGPGAIGGACGWRWSHVGSEQCAHSVRILSLQPAFGPSEHHFARHISVESHHHHHWGVVGATLEHAPQHV